MEGSTSSREGLKNEPLVESEYEGDGKPLVKAAKTNNDGSTSTYGTEIETSERAPTEEVRRIIENGLENIQQSCEELREENRSETEKKLEQLVKQTADFSQKYSNEYKLAKKELSSYIKFRRSHASNLLEPFAKSIREQFTRSTATDLIFYYLMNDKQPKTRPNTDTASRFYHSHNWYELCSYIMGVYSTEFYNRLDNNSAALEYVINKHPRLLLNQLSYFSVYTLCKYLPCERIHEMMMTVRDENGQTNLFYWIDGVPLLLINYYQNHTDKLYEILSIQNVNKQTVLHVKTIEIAHLLIFTYTPEQRDELTKLITIPDINNKTALDTAEGWVRDHLSWLIDQVKFPRYLQYDKPNVLIIYNTGERDGAEQEAKTIYGAFKSTKLFNTKLHKDKEKDEMLKLIEESANDEYYPIPRTALIVVLLSHGSVGVIDDCEGNPVNFTSIESAMCQKKLQNRPKILIAQCCQVSDDMSEHYKHSKKHDGNPSAHPREPYIPKNPDFCAIMSSVPGEASEREVFIPKLAEQIRNCKDNEDIELLVKRVCQQMLVENKTQTPVIQSTLKASFCPMNRNQFTKQVLLS